jgi:putative RNA 2'-phosphotransferase
MSSPQRRTQLSKLLSLILRHQPDKFGLTLDGEGFVAVADLLSAVRQQRGWGGVTAEEIREVVASSDKQRFEIVGERIRARYGHSVPERLSYPEVEPPEILYHGTSSSSLPAIRSEGLRAMRRQYVHLSTEPEQARVVGRRHSPDPVVLIVRAREAWQAGVKFYQPEARLFLAEAVPAEFVREATEDRR